MTWTVKIGLDEHPLGPYLPSSGIGLIESPEYVS